MFLKKEHASKEINPPDLTSRLSTFVLRLEERSLVDFLRNIVPQSRSGRNLHI
jgi:hypothetical protein